jgi:hypothetical protein
VTHHVRPRLGTDDALAIERHVAFTAPQRYHLVVLTRVLLDGAPLESLPDGNRRSFLCNGYESAPQPVNGFELVTRWWPRLAPGKHAIDVRSELSVYRGPPNVDTKLIWSDTVSSTHELTIAGATAAECVKLAVGGSPAIDVRFDDRSRSSDDVPHVALRIDHHDPTISVAGRIELRALDGTPLTTDSKSTFFGRAGTNGWSGLHLATPTLARGTYDVVVRIVPDPSVAIGESATVTEIHGLPIERRISVIVR